MIISDNIHTFMQNLKFAAAIKLICRCYHCKEIPPSEIIIQKAEEYEKSRVRTLNDLAKRKRVDLFFSDLYTMSWCIDEYEKIKKGGIIFTDIENNEIYNMLKTSENIIIDEFLTRSFDYACHEARKFKTKDGRNNYMKQYFKSLKSHNKQMYSDNIHRINALEMMTTIYGVEPKV